MKGYANSMPKRKVVVMTENGEKVTDITVYHARKRAPYPDWAIVPCLPCASFSDIELPLGVEAEIVVIMLLRAHDTTRNSELSKLLTRDASTICRALRRLERKGWIRRVEKGHWTIRRRWAYYGRWFERKFDGKSSS